MNSKIIFLLLGILFFIPLSKAYEYNLTAGNVSYVVNTTGNFTHISGEVINVTWIPRFDVDLGFLKCIFKPFEQPSLAESRYKMECDFLYNITKEQIYVPIPITLLKEFENIRGNERELAEKSSWLLFFQLYAVAITVIFFAILLYEYWWIYRSP